MTVTIRSEAEATEAEMVSGNYYSVLGVRPQLGRGIQESDDGSVGSGPVVTISDRLWTNRFGRSPDVIGKVILGECNADDDRRCESAGIHRRVLGAGHAGHLLPVQHAAAWWRRRSWIAIQSPSLLRETKACGGCW